MRGARRREKMRWTAGAVLVVVLVCQAPVAQAVLIDRVVAAVNNEAITWSDLKHAAGFNEALAGGVRDRKRLEAETLEGLINRRLLLQEARRLKLVEVSPQDVAAEVEKLRNRLGSETAFTDFIAGLDMTREEVGRMLGERLLTERFVEKKVGLLVRVSHDETQRYFGEHPGEFKGRRFQEVQKKIATFLTEQKVGRQAEQYLAELRSKADIRVNPQRTDDRQQTTDDRQKP